MPIIENPYAADWNWSGPNEPLDVPAKEDAAWYRPFIAEIRARLVDSGEVEPESQTTGGSVSVQP